MQEPDGASTNPIRIGPWKARVIANHVLFIALPYAVLVCFLVFAHPERTGELPLVLFILLGLMGVMLALGFTMAISGHAEITDTEVRTRSAFINRAFLLKDVQSTILLPTAKAPKRVLIWDATCTISFSYQTMSPAQLIQIYDVVRERAARLGNHIRPGFPPMPSPIKPSAVPAIALFYMLGIFIFIGVVVWTKLSR